MFKAAPATEPAPVDVGRADPVPLSQLSLDVDEPSVGWVVYLAGRGIPVDFDDVGRPSVSRADARQLLDEQHENEARVREVARRQEQQFIEADQAWRSQLSRGVPWWEFDGVSPAEAWAAAEAASRVSVHEELLQQELASSNSGMVYRSIQGDEKAS